MKVFPANRTVVHKTLGTGTVVSDLGENAVIRFDEEIEICSKADLELLKDIFDVLTEGDQTSSLEVITHFQAFAIKSINDKWGVFGRSKIDLLPHQLWVCRQAKSKTPCRLLVADDVGLGKTIEAGIILSSFYDAGKIARLLILTPASLASQWQYRMKDMFDIRVALYQTALDTEKSSYWECNDAVVASYNTLQFDHNGRMERMLSSPDWDLVVVDEAHHLNKADRNGATLAYELLKKMEDNQKINGLIFFTGTPHKGKNYNFLALMSLLSSQFSPNRPLEDQLHLLKDFMVRNNKYNVTDIHGKRLFQEPKVISSTYDYSPEEQEFYEALTEFISKGFAYAREQDHARGNVMMLILIVMQKLASSSVAAITHALKNRLSKLEAAEQEEKKKSDILQKYRESQDDENYDAIAELDEKVISTHIALIKNEIPFLVDLIHHAEQIQEETKIKTILDMIDRDYHDEQILFFTEYKSTQRLLLEKLMGRYGKGSTVFINGDEALDQVHLPDGNIKRINYDREYAAEQFNAGKCRFMIATEAGGEGIDLQEKCHILFHVDLPWNPMRLHQRVGRLNRYGQTQKVIVHTFRNPETVESRIWDKLNEKLLEINKTFSAVMEEKEDMFQLVLGMTSPAVFDDLFGKAPQNADDETLSRWFDRSTAQLGGKDIFKAVQEITGNAAKFDYQKVSDHLPQVDLPDLLPFWKNILSFNHKRLTINEDKTFSFQTPDSWSKKNFGVFSKYENYSFSRQLDRKHVLGIGAKVFDTALRQGLKLEKSIAIADINYTLVLISVQDFLTDHDGEKQKSLYACKIYEMNSASPKLELVSDWKILLLLNGITASSNIDFVKLPSDQVEQIKKSIPRIETLIRDALEKEDFRPKQPLFKIQGILLPMNPKHDEVN